MDAELTVVIPAYNESENLKVVLPQVLSYCEDHNWKIILVDDGSTDRTPELLKKIPGRDFLDVIRHKLNKGYGAAIKSGLAACSTKFVITIDADGQHQLPDIDRLLDHIKESDSDLVIGSRKGTQPAWSFRQLGKWIIRVISRILMTVPVYDLNSGMKIYRTSLVKKYLPLTPDGMSFSDTITLIFINHRHLVTEIPISLNKRISGQSKIRVQTAFQTVMEILNIVILFNPIKIFLPLAIVFFLLGLGWGLPIMFQGRGVSSGSFLGIVAGLIFFVLGLIAEQLAQIRRTQAEQDQKG